MRYIFWRRAFMVLHICLTFKQKPGMLTSSTTAQNPCTESAKLTYNLHKELAILCVSSGEYMVFLTPTLARDRSFHRDFPVASAGTTRPAPDPRAVLHTSDTYS